MIPLRERRKAIACRDRTAALVTIADAVISRYQAEKDRRGLLDYDDLIEKTLALLDKVDAAWVHYKLDRGIDHVLIDEAQDTSPQQWRIIRALTAEFFAGAGARAVHRTIFAVGDEKQSIFSFQGAAPREFDAMRRHFATLVPGGRPEPAIRAVPPLVPLGPQRAGRGRRGVRQTGSVQRTVGRQRADGARVAAGRDARPGRDLGHRSSPTRSARSKPGTRRSTN